MLVTTPYSQPWGLGHLWFKSILSLRLGLMFWYFWCWMLDFWFLGFWAEEGGAGVGLWRLRRWIEIAQLVASGCDVIVVVFVGSLGGSRASPFAAFKPRYFATTCSLFNCSYEGYSGTICYQKNAQKVCLTVKCSLASCRRVFYKKRGWQAVLPIIAYYAVAVMTELAWRDRLFFDTWYDDVQMHFAN